jgi:hypothetical protein
MRKGAVLVAVALALACCGGDDDDDDGAAGSATETTVATSGSTVPREVQIALASATTPVGEAIETHENECATSCSPEGMDNITTLTDLSQALTGTIDGLLDDEGLLSGPDLPPELEQILDQMRDAAEGVGTAGEHTRQCIEAGNPQDECVQELNDAVKDLKNELDDIGIDLEL